MAPKKPFNFFNSKTDVLLTLNNSPEALSMYRKLPSTIKEEFIDICTGRRGIPLHYDVFFKAIFSPDKHPKRLGRLLSQILGERVEVISSMSNEGSKISDRGSFVIMDIVVRLSNGEIVNLEIQKIGYLFPVKRFDCYCADLIMREYSRLREKHCKDFSYDMLPKVISIAMFETTPNELATDYSTYIQHSQMKTDMGKVLNSVPEHYYISLDNFSYAMHNKPIQTELEAWLMLISTVSIERINELIKFDSKFADIYTELFGMIVKPEELLSMYNNIFLDADKCEEQLMLDMMKNELKEKSAKLEQMDTQLAQMSNQFAQMNSRLQNIDSELQTRNNEIQAKASELQAKDSELQAKDSELQAKDEEIARLKKLLESNKSN